MGSSSIDSSRGLEKRRPTSRQRPENLIETTELYGGEIVCEFNPARHTYTIINKGRRYKVPSVTRITSVLDKSGPLVGWAINTTLDVIKEAIHAGTEYSEIYLEQVFKVAKQNSRSTKEAAADRGKAFHRLIEGSLRGDGQSDEGLAGAVKQWLTSLSLSPRSVEGRIYSRRYRYSGTYDCTAETPDGRLYLLDWKTSKAVYPEFRLQTAAYQHAWEEEHPSQPIEGRYLVRIAEDGSLDPHYYPRSTYRLDFKAFLGAKALFERVQVIEKEKKRREEK
jgi:hypothetical protein